MFALRVTYLTGRVYSARFEDGDEKWEPEWPPHPGRLFCALVAAWGETGEDAMQREALEWLEAREPAPTLLFSDFSERGRVDAFVPVNDAEVPAAISSGEWKDSEKEALGVFPETRPREKRRFPSLSLVDPEVYFVWNDNLPERLRSPMAQLAAATTYLGHSSCLVSVAICEQVPSNHTTLQPTEAGTIRLRVPTGGRLNYLRKQFEKFREKPIKIHRPNGGPTAAYALPSQGGPDRRHPSVFRDMIILQKRGGDFLPLPSTHQLASAMRRTLMSKAPQPCPEFISGHAPESTPENPRRSDRPHLAIAPLAYVGSRYARGQILGLAVLLPRTLTDEEAEICRQTVGRALQEPLRLARAGLCQLTAATTEAQMNLHPDPWVGPSELWATVTPYVFDFFPGNPYGVEAHEIVKAACERAGLPRPLSVAMLPVSPHIGVPPAGAFPPAPPRAGKPRRWHTHATLQFGEQVLGPITIGAGRYYGYGFCRPISETIWS